MGEQCVEITFTKPRHDIVAPTERVVEIVRSLAVAGCAGFLCLAVLNMGWRQRRLLTELVEIIVERASQVPIGRAGVVDRLDSWWGFKISKVCAPCRWNGR